MNLGRIYLCGLLFWTLSKILDGFIIQLVYIALEFRKKYERHPHGASRIVRQSPKRGAKKVFNPTLPVGRIYSGGF